MPDRDRGIRPIASTSRAYVPAAITLLCGLVLSGGLYQLLRSQDLQTAQYAFEAESQMRVRAIERVLHAHVGTVNWLAAILAAAPPGERAMFGRRISALPADDTGTLQLLWAPHGGRETYRVEAPAKSRTEHPLAGFDLMGDPDVAMYADFSKERQKTFIVSTSETAHEAIGPTAVLALRSVWTGGRDDSACAGFAVGAFEIDAVVDHALQPFDPGVVNLDVFDAFAPPGSMSLYNWRTETEGTVSAPLSERSILGIDGIHHTSPIELGGTRRWLFVCTPTPEFLAGTGSWQPLLGLAAGLLLTAFVTNHFLAQIRERRKAEQLVMQRTGELRETNARLTAEIGERKRFEAERDELLALLERSNESLQQVNDELARSNEELQEFAVVASHDLKEPLRKITVLADTLRTKVQSNGENGAGEYVSLIHEGAARMMGRIANVLDVSRVRTHGKPFEPVDIEDAIDDVLDDLRVRVEETRGRVEVDGPFPNIEADPVQIRQLLQNLIENGLKYAQPDVPPRVRVSVGMAGGGEVELCIEDNGLGIPESAKDRIFSLYQRADGDGSHEGSGVGLAVCRRIVERHNGSIHAEPAGESGTRFIIRLPATQTRSDQS